MGFDGSLCWGCCSWPRMSDGTNRRTEGQRRPSNPPVTYSTVTAVVDSRLLVGSLKRGRDTGYPLQSSRSIVSPVAGQSRAGPSHLHRGSTNTQHPHCIEQQQMVRLFKQYGYVIIFPHLKGAGQRYEGREKDYLVGTDLGMHVSKLEDVEQDKVS